jgi:two-component system nitrate/nitrite response regulator NarL
MRQAETKVLTQELTHTKASRQATDQRVMTLVISTNALLRTGVQHILAGTRFALINQPVDPFTSLPLGPEDVPVLILIDGQTARSPDKVVGFVKAKHPHARAVVLAEQFHFDFLMQARQAGVDGFCLTRADPKVLITSLELVMLGSRCFRLLWSCRSSGRYGIHRRTGRRSL